MHRGKNRFAYLHFELLRCERLLDFTVSSVVVDYTVIYSAAICCLRDTWACPDFVPKRHVVTGITNVGFISLSYGNDNVYENARTWDARITVAMTVKHIRRDLSTTIPKNIS